MPSTSQKQQKLFGMAYSYKKGQLLAASPEIKRLADSLTVKQLHDFAATKHHGLPKHAAVGFLARSMQRPIAGLSMPGAMLHEAYGMLGGNVKSTVAPYWQNNIKNVVAPYWQNNIKNVVAPYWNNAVAGNPVKPPKPLPPPKPPMPPMPPKPLAYTRR